jgi:hypothetical protein
MSCQSGTALPGIPHPRIPGTGICITGIDQQVSRLLPDEMLACNNDRSGTKGILRKDSRRV